MKTISGMIMTLLLLTACTGCDNNEEAFSDPAFKACVEARLKDYSEFDEREYKIENEKDLEVIKLLACGSRGITSVKGIEKLLNIDDLRVNTNQIASVEPIRQLKKLEVLQIGDNKLEDIEPLSGATNLKTLQLAVNYIADIKPLKGLLKLETLGISENCITDFTQIEELKESIPDVEIGGATAEEQSPEKCQ